jgi:hypothetical protein
MQEDRYFARGSNWLRSECVYQPRFLDILYHIETAFHLLTVYLTTLPVAQNVVHRGVG